MLDNHCGGGNNYSSFRREASFLIINQSLKVLENYLNYKVPPGELEANILNKLLFVWIFSWPSAVHLEPENQSID